jgi:hypothetical protein
MQRWLAALLLTSLMIGQLSAVACPVAHHADPEETPVATLHTGHAGHSAAPIPTPESFGETPASTHHGQGTQCDMMVTCAGLMTLFSPGQGQALTDDGHLDLAAPADSHANPVFKTPTPPPKLA